MPTTAKPAFTIAEILVTLIMLGVVAAMVIPKILYNNDDKTVSSYVRESYSIVGEMFLSRATNPNYPPVIMGDGERSQFGQFIYDHLDYTSAINPGSVGNYCAANNYFVLHTGAIIRQICDGNGNGGDVDASNILVVIQVPTTSQNATFTYTMIIPKAANRYTTLYGFTKQAGDWTKADNYLNVAATQP